MGGSSPTRPDSMDDSSRTPPPQPAVTPTEERSDPFAAERSPAPSNGNGKKKGGRVRFNSIADVSPREDKGKEKDASPPLEPEPLALTVPSGPKRPRPSLVRGSSYNSVLDNMDGPADEGISPEKAMSAAAAHQRAQQWAASTQGDADESMNPFSNDNSIPRRNSYDSDNDTVQSNGDLMPSAIPLSPPPAVPEHQPRESHHRRDTRDPEKIMPPQDDSLNSQAANLVRAHTQRMERSRRREFPVLSNGTNNNITVTPPDATPTTHHRGPIHDFQDGADFAPPSAPKGNVLSQLLQLYAFQQQNSSSDGRSIMSGQTTPGDMTPGTSGTATPTRRKWYQEKDAMRSQDTLAALIGASAKLSMDPNAKPMVEQGGSKDATGALSPNPAAKQPKRPKHRRGNSYSKFNVMANKKAQEEARITIHVADILKRQQYIIKMCRALMLYGAPTHRLEEYLTMAARVLEIQGQFLYIPGCMIISFDDSMTHTTEVKIVRTRQSVELGRLKDVHEIYKEVLHDVISLDEAVQRLESVMLAKDQFHPWLRVVVYGLASVTVAPFAFSARMIDLPIAFIMGCIVGFLQLIIAPMSDLYGNVFEIVAAVLTSFLARAFGSIKGGELFCFSALAQSSIALILPGYLVLCSALELQSKSIVPGSIRMVYAIIYSLFLGFGITVGTALYGAMDSKATSSTTCQPDISEYTRFAFVPLFAICLAFINQAKWKQMPMMTGIAMAGYVVNFFSTKKFSASPQIANTLGAVAVGILANLYSRLRHGVAAAAMLPAIFVQVPSGLAASGSLLSGLSTANELTHTSNATINGTSTVSMSSASATATSSSGSLDTIVFNVAASMIQIAIGITVGLFIAAIIVYPFGKRRSGLFTL